MCLRTLRRDDDELLDRKIRPCRQIFGRPMLGHLLHIAPALAGAMEKDDQRPLLVLIFLVIGREVEQIIEPDWNLLLKSLSLLLARGWSVRRADRREQQQR